MKRPADTPVREWRAVRRIMRRASREQRRHQELRSCLLAVAAHKFHEDVLLPDTPARAGQLQLSDGGVL